MKNDVLESIKRRRASWVAAINDGSAEGFAAVVTEDAVWLPSMSDAIVGRKNIRTWLERPFAEFDYDYSVSDVMVRSAGDYAVEHARFVTRVQASDGRSMPVHEGRYVVIWRKTESDGWLIERYVDLSADFEQAV